MPLFSPSPLLQDQCAEIEDTMQGQNEEMMALVMEQYNSMSLSMEEEKKAKLEQLYDQIVSSQENIDSAKGILETTVREAETEARVSWSSGCLDVSKPIYVYIEILVIPSSSAIDLRSVIDDSFLIHLPSMCSSISHPKTLRKGNSFSFWWSMRSCMPTSRVF